MHYTIILPVINEEMSDGCIASIAPSVRKHIVIVDNSASKFGEKYRNDVCEVITPPENIGVARAWNLGATIALYQKADYLIIISATMRFGHGMLDFIKKLRANNNPYGLESQHGWHCIAIGTPTIEKVGMWDENFYPAYYEDSDYIRRMELAGIHEPMKSSPRLPKVDVDAEACGNAHGLKSGVIVNMGACRSYFIRKWGNDPRYETQEYRDSLFRHPFNNAEFSITYWKPRSIQTLKRRYNIS